MLTRKRGASMTYCLGILLPTGLVLAADSRSNAGVDQIALARKMALITVPGDRVIAILSAGNLATTQSVVSQLRHAAGSGDAEWDVHAARNLFDVAAMVGTKLREVVDRDTRYVQSYGDPTGSFLVGGQISGEEPRLFQVYSAGNFIEASSRSRFLQIGETKYGKPILDRVLDHQTSLDEAAKLAMLSFDATIRSNLSVGPPIDLLRYQIDSFSVANLQTVVDGDPYWTSLKRGYAEGLSSLVDTLPCPPSATEA
ncbi:MAG: peptidase [Caulobacteraceae bacterium]|nr:peptidase [Caulobacteraceae bacterium]